jgi:hypothetical protein
LYFLGGGCFQGLWPPGCFNPSRFHFGQISKLRRIAALLSETQELDGITVSAAKELDKAICKAIIDSLTINGGINMAPVNQFAAWCRRADYRLPVEIFTVNYDLLLETALENYKVRYFDGFIGSLKGRFDTELVENISSLDKNYLPSIFVRLWKLHGSVNWAWIEDHQIVRLGQPVADGQIAAIYPSDAKYDESRRIPFVVLQDRFRRSLNMGETLMIVAGYSFNDQHLNEMIFEAATQRARSEFAIFCYEDISDMLVEKALITPNLQIISGSEAIIGGVRKPWEHPSDSIPNLWIGDKCGLGDFSNLAAYLARSANI